MEITLEWQKALCNLRLKAFKSLKTLAVLFPMCFFLNSITSIFYTQFDFVLVSNEEPGNNYLYSVIFQRHF